MFINDGICWYFKNLWVMCKKLWLNKSIHGFWTSNGSIRLKVTEAGNVCVITDDADLEGLFPGNKLIVTIHVKFHGSSFYVLLGFFLKKSFTFLKRVLLSMFLLSFDFFCPRYHHKLTTLKLGFQSFTCDVRATYNFEQKNNFFSMELN